ncbi:hypothetical protein HMPREF1988_00181 [Porphyromonas gingivalis F0185]|nr:hypothetical protein HMPREF1988_00181 [Porphyromonas gingivalis F0185]
MYTNKGHEADAHESVHEFIILIRKLVKQYDIEKAAKTKNWHQTKSHDSMVLLPLSPLKTFSSSPKDI